MRACVCSPGLHAVHAPDTGVFVCRACWVCARAGADFTVLFFCDRPGRGDTDRKALEGNEFAVACQHVLGSWCRHHLIMVCVCVCVCVHVGIAYMSAHLHTCKACRQAFSCSYQLVGLIVVHESRVVQTIAQGTRHSFALSNTNLVIRVVLITQHLTLPFT